MLVDCPIAPEIANPKRPVISANRIIFVHAIFLAFIDAHSRPAFAPHSGCDPTPGHPRRVINQSALSYWWVKPVMCDARQKRANQLSNDTFCPVSPQPDHCAHKTYPGADGKVHSPIFDSKKMKDPIDFLILSTISVSRGVI